MADKSQVVTSSTLLRNGKGVLVGIVFTTSGDCPLATFYDNTSGSGTKLFEAYIVKSTVLNIFFPERYSIPFSTGLYLSLAANISATVWWREY